MDTDTTATDLTKPALAPAPTVKAEPVQTTWTNTTVVANGPIPSGAKPVIVVETRTDDGDLDASRQYPAGADLYFRYSAHETLQGVDPGAQMHTLGATVMQGGFAGLNDHAQLVNVGPASPIYAAVNVAYKNGAKTVTIVGASPQQQAQLKPWFANPLVADKVAVTFAA